MGPAAGHHHCWYRSYFRIELAESRAVGMKSYRVTPGCSSVKSEHGAGPGPSHLKSTECLRQRKQ